MQAKVSHNKTAQTGCQGQYQAFSEQLPHQAASCGAKSRPRRHFLLARQAARQQQVGHIHRRNQQDAADRREEHQENGSDAAETMLIKRSDARQHSGVGMWILRI